MLRFESTCTSAIAGFGDFSRTLRWSDSNLKHFLEVHENLHNMVTRGQRQKLQNNHSKEIQLSEK